MRGGWGLGGGLRQDCRIQGLGSGSILGVGWGLVDCLFVVVGGLWEGTFLWLG